MHTDAAGLLRTSRLVWESALGLTYRRRIWWRSAGSSRPLRDRSEMETAVEAVRVTSSTSVPLSSSRGSSSLWVCSLLIPDSFSWALEHTHTHIQQMYTRVHTYTHARNRKQTRSAYVNADTYRLIQSRTIIQRTHIQTCTNTSTYMRTHAEPGANKEKQEEGTHGQPVEPFIAHHHPGNWETRGGAAVQKTALHQSRRGGANADATPAIRHPRGAPPDSGPWMMEPFFMSRLTSCWAHDLHPAQIRGERRPPGQMEYRAEKIDAGATLPRAARR